MANDTTSSSSSSAPEPEAPARVQTMAEIQALIDQAQARHWGPPSFAPDPTATAPRRFLLVPFTEAEIQTDAALQNILRGATEDTGLRKLALQLYAQDPGPSPNWSEDDLVKRFNALTAEEKQSLVADAAAKIPLRLPYPPQDYGQPPPGPQDIVFVLGHGRTDSAQISCGSSQIDAQTLLNRMRGDGLVPADTGRIKLISCGGDHTLHPDFIAQCQANNVYGQSMVTAYGMKDQDSQIWHNNSPLAHLDKGLRSVDGPPPPSHEMSRLEEKLKASAITMKFYQDHAQKSSEALGITAESLWMHVETLHNLKQDFLSKPGTDAANIKQLDDLIREANTQLKAAAEMRFQDDAGRKKLRINLWDQQEEWRKSLAGLGFANSQKINATHKTQARPADTAASVSPGHLTGGSSSSSATPEADADIAAPKEKKRLSVKDVLVSGAVRPPIQIGSHRLPPAPLQKDPTPPSSPRLR
ncbi:hypothetical protein [Prosthecobacter debontii]|nr:hypothetical protein [Prosthecobacter debontii]